MEQTSIIGPDGVGAAAAHHNASGSSSASASVSSTAAATIADGGGGGGGVNPLDDMTDIKKWLSQGRLDSKNLAKRFPHTARDLQEGKASPEAVECHILESSGLFYQDHLFLWERLALLVLPPECRSSRNASLHQGFVRQLRVNIAHRDAESKCKVDSVQIREAVKDTCHAWGNRIDKMMNAKKGTYLKSNVVFNKTQDEFTKDIFPHIVDRNKAKLGYDLCQAAQGIADGVVHIERSCWECGKQSSKKLSICAKCNVARYCSSDCQTNAWKTGHRHKCSVLADKNEMFLESLQWIEDSCKNNGSGNPEWDCNALFSLVTFNADYFKTTINMESLPGPSMKLAFENLERIVMSGKWWFYPPEEELTLEEYHAHRRCLHQHDDVLQEEFKVFSEFWGHLAFDYIQFCVDHVHCKSGYIETVFHAVGQVQKERFGLAMPASRFLELYNQGVARQGTARGMKSSTRQWKGTARVRFQQCFHK